MYKQKVKVEGHSVQKLEWKRTDGRTDRGIWPNSRVKAVGKYSGKSV